MAKQEFKYFQGKIGNGGFCKLHHPDVEYGNWATGPLYLTEKSLSEFQELKNDLPDGTEGILNEVKLDDNGKYINLKRPMKKNFGKGDEHLTPPIVLDKDGNPTKENIGTGSDITAKCVLYTWTRGKRKGRAIRLEAVRIDNLVPYQRKDLTEQEEQTVSGLDQQPAQPF